MKEGLGVGATPPGFWCWVLGVSSYFPIRARAPARNHYRVRNQVGKVGRLGKLKNLKA